LAIQAFFPLDDEMRATIVRLMTEVADADALRIDLRENHGGQPDTVALLVSSLFDPEPVRLSDIHRRDDGST
jgi:C-terminal processing protease CtpA/Prc